MGLLSKLGRSANKLDRSASKINRGLKKLNSGTEEASQLLDNLDQLTSDIQEIRGEEEEVQDEEKDLKQKEDQTEKEEAQEEPDPEETAYEIGIEIEELEDIEAKIRYIEEQIYEAINEAEEVENEVYQEEERAEAELEDVQQTLTQVMDELQQLTQEHRNKIRNQDNAQQMSFEERQQVRQEIEQETIQDLEAIEEKLQEVKDVFGVEEVVDGSIQGLKKDLKMLNRTLNSFMEEVEGLKTLEQELEDEEMKEEKILEHYNDKADWETVKKEEGETKRAVKKLKKIIEDKKKLDREIQDARDRLKKERNFEVQEEQELETILEELARIDNELGTLKSTIMTDMGESRSETEFGRQIESVQSDIEDIEKEGQQVMNDLS